MVKIGRKTKADVTFGNETYNDVRFTLLDKIIAEVQIGLKLLKKHKSVTPEFGGNMKPLNCKSSFHKKLLVAIVIPHNSFSLRR